MLSPSTEILPLCLVRWLARRYCERVTIGTREAHTARPDALIVVKETQ